MESSVQSIRESCEGAAARAVRRVQYAPGDLIGSKYVVDGMHRKRACELEGIPMMRAEFAKVNE